VNIISSAPAPGPLPLLRRRPALAAGRRWRTALTTLLLLCAASAAQGQQHPSKRQGAAWPAPRASTDAAQVHAVTPLTALDSIAESEPNDTPAQANEVALGSRVHGVISAGSDRDFFAVEVTGDTVLELEVFASRGGSPLDPILFLYGPDGTTILAVNDDHHGSLDSRIVRRVRDPGRYFVAVEAWAGMSGSAAHWYRLTVQASAPDPPGPGDPIVERASRLGFASQLAAGPEGELYVGDQMGRVLRISPSWQVTQVATVASLGGLVVDGLGDVLVSQPETGEIRRFRGGQGASTAYISGLAYPAGLTLAPNGDVLVIEQGSGHVRRFGPAGNLKGSVAPTGFSPWVIAVSPAGVLHGIDGGPTIHREVGGQWVVARTLPGLMLGGLAFDDAGYLYVGTAESGVLLLDPELQPVGGAFVTESDGVVALAFARDAQGAMTSRLFGLNLGFTDQSRLGTLDEYNAQGIPRVGQRVGVDLLRITTQTLRNGVMGAAYADTLRAQAAATVWSLESGTLPAGLELDPASGVISGHPAVSGPFTFYVRVENGGMRGYQGFPIQITRPGVQVGDAAQHLLGVPGLLGEDLLRFLDLQGNANGRYDVGDFRALVRSLNLSAADLPADFQALMGGN